MKTSKLRLNRETLRDISVQRAKGVRAGANITNLTCFSCLTFVSCNPLDCIQTTNCID